MNHSEIVFGVAFPAGDDAPKVLQPSEQPLDLPAAPRTAQSPSILRRRAAPIAPVRRDQLGAVQSPQPSRQGSAVVGFVADQPRGRRAQKTRAESGLGEGDLMRASAGHVHGERKTMAVCNRHEIAAFSAAIIAHSRAPFLALLKLPSMKASDRSSLPRSRKSSASFCRRSNSWPERCHC